MSRGGLELGGEVSRVAWRPRLQKISNNKTDLVAQPYLYSSTFQKSQQERSTSFDVTSKLAALLDDSTRLPSWSSSQTTILFTLTTSRPPYIYTPWLHPSLPGRKLLRFSFLCWLKSLARERDQPSSSSPPSHFLLRLRLDLSQRLLLWFLYTRHPSRGWV